MGHRTTIRERLGAKYSDVVFAVVHAVAGIGLCTGADSVGYKEVDCSFGDDVYRIGNDAKRNQSVIYRQDA